MTVQKSKKNVVRSGCSGNGRMKPGPDIIEISATDKLIKEVEKICGGVNPDPCQIEKEHERALIDAIGKLADVSDGDDSSNRQKQHQYSNEERDRIPKGFIIVLMSRSIGTGTIMATGSLCTMQKEQEFHALIFKMMIFD